MTKSSIAIVLLLSAWLVSCGSEPQEKHEPVIEEELAAKSTGRILHLYTALDENEAKIYIRAFEEETWTWLAAFQGYAFGRPRTPVSVDM